MFCLGIVHEFLNRDFHGHSQPGEWDWARACGEGQVRPGQLFTSLALLQLPQAMMASQSEGVHCTRYTCCTVLRKLWFTFILGNKLIISVWGNRSWQFCTCVVTTYDKNRTFLSRVLLSSQLSHSTTTIILVPLLRVWPVVYEGREQCVCTLWYVAFFTQNQSFLFHLWIDHSVLICSFQNAFEGNWLVAPCRHKVEWISLRLHTFMEVCILKL